MMNSQMENTFLLIEARIMDGKTISQSDRKFYNSYLSVLKNTKAGNSGKRKEKRAGK